MRLGKDAIVFTKTRDTMSVGLLSQSYLEAIGAQRVMVPIITFRRDGHNQYCTFMKNIHVVTKQKLLILMMSFPAFIYKVYIFDL